VSARAASGDARGPALIGRDRAARLLVGLSMFALGFAIAGALVVSNVSGTPWVLAVVLGLVGLVFTGLAMRGASGVLPQQAVWSPFTLRLIAERLGIPAVPLMVVLYGLTALGVLGNVILPLAGR
jgi:hypothetical protein